MEFRPHEQILVEWRDAYHDFEWNGEDPHRKDYVVKTSGFYISHDKKWLHFAMEVLPDGAYRGLSHIPVSLIITINGRKYEKDISGP